MRRGFTLIEVMVTVSIIMVVASFSMPIITGYKKIKNENDIKVCQMMIMSMINNGKLYCRERNKSGYVLFDIVKDEVTFYCDNKKIDKFIFPKGIDLKSINTKFSKVDINNLGITSDAGTIVIRDENNTNYEITINVGVGHVEIK